jgi:hypothetical protein
MDAYTLVILLLVIFLVSVVAIVIYNAQNPSSTKYDEKDGLNNRFVSISKHSADIEKSVQEDSKLHARIDESLKNSFDGNYDNLTNKPILFDGDYEKLKNKPNINRDDLSDYNKLINKPDLFNGQYDSLIGKPLLFDGNWSNLHHVPSLFKTSWEKIENKPHRYPTKWDKIDDKPDRYHTNWDMIHGKPTKYDTTWGQVQGKPIKYDTTWGQVEGKPIKYDTTWGQVEGKPDKFDTTWGQVEDKPDKFDTTWGQVEGKPDKFDTTWGQVQGKPDNFDTTWRKVKGKPKKFDTTWDQIEGKPQKFNTTWSNIDDKPDKFPTNWDMIEGKPVTGQTAIDNWAETELKKLLDEKASTVHTHNITEIQGFNPAEYALLNHNHAYENITGLSAELDKKQNVLLAGDNIIIKGSKISALHPNLDSYAKKTDIKKTSDALKTLLNKKQNSLTAGNNIIIKDSKISAVQPSLDSYAKTAKVASDIKTKEESILKKIETKQNKLTAGTNITINNANNTISAPLTGYATKASLNNYATKASLNNYAPKSSLGGYATKSSLNTTNVNLNKKQDKLTSSTDIAVRNITASSINGISNNQINNLRHTNRDIQTQLNEKASISQLNQKANNNHSHYSIRPTPVHVHNSIEFWIHGNAISGNTNFHNSGLLSITKDDNKGVYFLGYVLSGRWSDGNTWHPKVITIASSGHFVHIGTKSTDGHMWMAFMSILVGSGGVRFKWFN